MQIVEEIFDHLFLLSLGTLGDLASIAGVAIALIGFAVTLQNVRRSKEAAEDARKAANEARTSIRSFETVSDFSSAIAIIEEIKRLHRERAWKVLPDRYEALRKLLVSVRTANPALGEEHQVAIQAAITTISEIEGKIERAIEASEEPKQVAKMNSVLSERVSELHEMLVELKSKNSG